MIFSDIADYILISMPKIIDNCDVRVVVYGCYWRGKVKGFLFRQVSEKYRIKASTLYKTLNNKLLKPYGRPSALTVDEEIELVVQT